jgi:amino acid adenylation domain-containing protein
VTQPGQADPVQVVSDDPAFAPSWSGDQDLSGLDERQQQAALATWPDPADARTDGPADTSAYGLRLTLARLGCDRHALLIGLPILCADAPALISLVRAIAGSYDDPGRAEEPLQYADVTIWLHDLLDTPEARLITGLWTERMPKTMDGPAPFERTGPAPAGPRAASVEVPWDTETMASLAALARRQQVSVAGLLLAAWQSLLWRHDERAAVALTADGRGAGQLGDVIGLLARSLPVPIRVEHQEPFTTVARRAEELLREGASDEAFCTWESSPAAGGPGAERYFPVGYEFRKYPARWTDGGLSWQIQHLDADVDRYKLRLAVREQDGELRTRIDFDGARFRPEDVRQLAAQFQVLLRHVSGAPGTPVGELRLISDGERQRLVTGFNRTEATVPGQTLAELFSAQAARTPDQPAVISGPVQLSYAELDRRSSQLAHRLRALGVRAEVPVGLLLERSAELPLAILGVLKAGGAYVPLDPAHPAQRLAYLLSDSRPRVVLTQSSLAVRLEESVADHHPEVLYVDSAGTDLAGEPAVAPPSTVHPGQTAYIIYTSGSTGQPKGVQVTHGGLMNYLNWAAGAYHVGDGQGALVDGPVSVDLAITGLLSPLLAGRAVTLVPAQAPAGGLVGALLTGSDHSLVKVTPLTLDLASAEPDAAAAARRTRAFIIGGENLTAGTTAFWRRHAPGTRLVNEYGPTETVVGCCTYTVTADTPDTGSVPIGRPIGNMRLYVLDDAMQPVPTGVIGEIHIGGPGVARGYLGRPGLTADRFVPDPFSRAPGDRLYRTGDLGRFAPDGNLEYLGRSDHQLKVHGYRVEPGEVEATLRDHPDVRGVVVIAHQFGPGDQRLVAYVAGDRAEADELRQFVAERLPAPMVPSVFVPVTELPVSASGKVDRDRLPDPQPNRDGTTEEFAPARTPVEREITSLFTGLLRLDRVGLHDDFFDLGGTSVLLAQLTSQLARSYDMDRSMTQLLRSPTVADVVHMITMSREDGRDAVLADGVALAAVDAQLDDSISLDYQPVPTPTTTR